MSFVGFATYLALLHNDRGNMGPSQCSRGCKGTVARLHSHQHPRLGFASHYDRLALLELSKARLDGFDRPLVVLVRIIRV